MSSRILRSKSSHKWRSSVESPCQQGSCELLWLSVFTPNGGGREILCPPPPTMLHLPMESEYRSNCAQGQGHSLQKVFTCGNSQHREAMASKLLATAANLQKAWCSVCRSSRDSPHSLSACSPEAFFSFCNPIRARYPTRLHINGKWKEGQEWRPLEYSIQFSPVPEILRHLSEMPSTPHPCSTLKSTHMLR